MNDDLWDRFKESARKGRREAEIRAESAALDAAAELLAGETVYVTSIGILRLLLDNLPTDHLPEYKAFGAVIRVWYSGGQLVRARRAIAAENLLAEVERDW